MSAKSNIKKNIVSAVLYQLFAIISGFYINRLILSTYGSNVNGLVSSIGNFLSFFSLLDMGLGASMTASLYGPIFRNDQSEISKIITSGQKVVNKLSVVLVVYIFLLSFTYPSIIKDFGFAYIFALVITLGLSNFSQYYFGRVYGVLIAASQEVYIYQYILLVVSVEKVVISTIMVRTGFSVHFFYIGMSISYLLQPFLVNLYVKKHYNINKKALYTEEPIKQKWNGLFQRFATVVLENTDVAVLTFLAPIETVSVYSVYNMILVNISKFLVTANNGLQSFMGARYAKGNDKAFKKIFRIVEFSVQKLSLFIFGSCCVLIEPFVMVYTKGVTDVDYSNVSFGVMLSTAYFVQIYRHPYIMLMHATGEFKETQVSAFVEMIINILVSICAYYYLGIIGVTLGTIMAVSYRTVWLGIYFYKHILEKPSIEFIKNIFLDVLILILFIIIGKRFSLTNYTYLNWAFLSIKEAGLLFIIIVIITCVFQRSEFLDIISLCIVHRKDGMPR